MTETREHYLLPTLYDETVERALREDVGSGGDLTTESLVPQTVRAKGVIVATKAGCIAGLDVALGVYRRLERDVTVVKEVVDGAYVEPGQPLASLAGSARTLLTAERTALNFLGRMSGIATITRELVTSIDDYKARIVCTRKTAPGLRVLDKYSVRVGGGSNHRFGLSDGVLIKDNHLRFAGSIKSAVEDVRHRLGHMIKVEVEVDTLQQLEELLKLNVDAVLLDNMRPGELSQAVAMVNGSMLTEASGGITPESVISIASCGVDLISLGWITHSCKNLDVSFEMEPM